MVLSPTIPNICAFLEKIEMLPICHTLLQFFKHGSNEVDSA